MDDVIIANYDPGWPDRYEEEAARLRDVLGDVLLAIAHVGSTSVPGLAAKPIIDILVLARSFQDAQRNTSGLAAIGYECLGENGIPGRLFFRKGMPRTHHVHIVETGHHQWPDNLEFRDYLRQHPEEAAQYASLKRALARRFRHRREDYTNGKSEYILGVLRKARGQTDGSDVTLCDT